MISAGIDCGAKNTKTIIMKDGKIIGKGKQLTGFDQKQAVETSLEEAIQAAGIGILGESFGEKTVIDFESIEMFADS